MSHFQNLPWVPPPITGAGPGEGLGSSTEPGSVLMRRRGLGVYLSNGEQVKELNDLLPGSGTKAALGLVPGTRPGPTAHTAGPSSRSSLCLPSWLCIQSAPHKCPMQGGDEQQRDAGRTRHHWCLEARDQVSALNACTSPAPAEPTGPVTAGVRVPSSPSATAPSMHMPRGGVSMRRGLLGRGPAFQHHRPSASSTPGLGSPRQGPAARASLVLS